MRTAFVFLLTLAAAAQARKPNLVILYADDMGYNDASFNGRKEWSTANLDRLASEGTIFDRWYTAYPLCAPSRAALLSGKYGIHTGVRNNQGELSLSETILPEALRPAGYRTALIGKWHRGNAKVTEVNHPLDHGFDETYGYLDALHAWEHFPKKLWRGRVEEDVSGYSSDLLAAEAIKFVQANRDRPFLLYVPFIEPHFWVEAPEENLKKFRGKFPEKDASKPYNAHYAAMMERFDASIGRLVKAIDDAGLRENTLIVFTSDNGATFEERTYGAPAFHDSNKPFRGQKRSLEEGGIRMPSFVRWPGRVPAGKRSDTVMHMTDVMPTFLAAAGVSPDPAWGIGGKNMLDVWTAKSPAPDRTVFWEFTVEGWYMHAAMRGDWKLLRIGETNRFLYNVKEDPQERRTRAGEHPDVVKSLQAELDDWLKTAKQN
jgi:arylsulfatase A-like enzyme